MPHTQYKGEQKIVYTSRKHANHESELEEMQRQSQKLNLKDEIGSIMLMDVKEM